MDPKPMLPEGTLDGRVIVITGGGTGLGRSIAESAARLGARLVLASRDPSHLEAARGAIASHGGEAIAVPTDVRDYRQARALIRAATERFGRIDGLVNNAAGNFVRPAEKLPETAFSNVVDIVLNGTFYCSRAAGRAMIDAGHGGAILNILATYAWTGGPGTIHSACAKAGVLAMTRTLAVEWARHGIRVNGLAPGPLDTDGASARLWPSEEFEQRVRGSIPLGRFANLREISDAALYLLSDHASYVTGEVLTLDGGAWLGRGVLGAEDGGAVPVVRRRRT
jgi:NAD(P)-dependent dehydrogenase (short-subunit alcohol dehydrogenase family)